MALSAAQIAKLNKMNRAAQDSTLGTLLGIIEGQGNVASELSSKVGTSGNTWYTVTGDDATANEAVIFDRTSTGIAISTFIVQVYRSDVLMDKIKVTNGGFTLTLKDNSTDYELTEGDVVNVIVF